jgi:hypothetical protein
MSQSRQIDQVIRCGKGTRLALFMTLCEGEYEIARDALASLLAICPIERPELFLIDDASPSRVGRRIAEQTRRRGIITHCLEMPHQLGFFGTGRRTFRGLEWVASHGEFDLLVKIEPDALVLRPDTFEMILSQCRDGIGLFGEAHALRRRDLLLYLLDHAPVGLRRHIDRTGIIRRKWELGRLRPVWWSDFGRRAIMNGFRFCYLPACFFFLGGKTLKALHEQGILARLQEPRGFVCADDVLLTTAVWALGHPVVNLADSSPHWGYTMGMDEDAPLEVVRNVRPYVVHPLKNRPRAWARRRTLRDELGLGEGNL